jgi:N-acetylneuraminate lyase
VARAAVKHSGGKGRVILHAGCLRESDAVDLARYGESIGVDAISSLPPYVARWSGTEVVEYYARLSSATRLPCFVYYFPALTGNASGDAFFDAIRKLPGVSGVKFTDMNLYELGNLAGGTWTVLNGHDQVLYPALTMGANGGIGSFYNVLPEEFVTLFRAWRAGDFACARAAQERINRVIRVVKQFRLLPALKFIAGLQGVNLGVCRKPTLALSGEEQNRLRAALAALGVCDGCRAQGNRS